MHPSLQPPSVCWLPPIRDEMVKRRRKAPMITFILVFVNDQRVKYFIWSVESGAMITGAGVVIPSLLVAMAAALN